MLPICLIFIFVVPKKLITNININATLSTSTKTTSPSLSYTHAETELPLRYYHHTALAIFYSESGARALWGVRTEALSRNWCIDQEVLHLHHQLMWLTGYRAGKKLKYFQCFANVFVETSLVVAMRSEHEMRVIFSFMKLRFNIHDHDTLDFTYGLLSWISVRANVFQVEIFSICWDPVCLINIHCPDHDINIPSSQFLH